MINYLLFPEPPEELPPEDEPDERDPPPDELLPELRLSERAGGL